MRKPALLLLLALFLAVATLSVPTHARAETRRNVRISMDVEREPAMWTVTKDAFYGGVLGGLVALAGLFISEFEMPPQVFGYCAGAGILVGTGVGIWEVATRDDLVSEMAAGPPELAPSQVTMVRVPVWRF